MELTKKQATIKYCVYCLLIVIADAKCRRIMV